MEGSTALWAESSGQQNLHGTDFETLLHGTDFETLFGKLSAVGSCWQLYDCGRNLNWPHFLPCKLDS